MTSSSFLTFSVYISHAGEDKASIAFPLREKLLRHGITAFVDDKDMAGGTWSEQAMITAMETADIAVVVLGPEFVSRKWPMKELYCFLRRSEEPAAHGRTLPVIIPLFYRLTIQELYDEPRLDRLDENGKSIYRSSRFFERMENGEPEANMANVKTALRKLHGVMGIENYVDASNDNTKTMFKRRDVLLNDLCNSVRNALSRISEGVRPYATTSQSDGNAFRSHYHQEDSISDLVLDFGKGDHIADVTTVEASVLQAVLETSQSANVISIQGMSGVGKTTVLCGLLSLDVVKQRFEDGTHLISLGADATPAVLIDALCTTVNLFGGDHVVREMRKENNWKHVFKHFRAWFTERNCLFMVDDLWETSEITSSMIHELVKLQLCGMSSKVLLTTRSTEIASRADKCFFLQPREPQESQCHNMLVRYSGVRFNKADPDNVRAVNDILRICCGLPLFLKIAGRAIRALSLRHKSEGSIAYQLYSRTLSINMQGLLNTDVDSYERLSSSLSVSVNLIEDRKDRWDFSAPLSSAEMYRRLSVIAKQYRAPMTMLRHLWELRNEAEATIVSREFEQIALASVYIEETDLGYAEYLTVHDSMHEYAVGETRKRREETLGHKVLLESYGRRLTRDQGCRTWWSRSLEPDGYVHRNVCRHLAFAGLGEELVRLLLKPEWTIRYLDECGILEVERGYALGKAAVKDVDKRANYDCQTGANKGSQVEQALQMVSHATRLSLGYTVTSPRELCFQLYGRLMMHAKENLAVAEFLNRLESKADELWGPWLKSISPFMEPLGSAITKIFDVRYVSDMVLSDDGNVVYCVSRSDKIIAVETASGDIVHQLRHVYRSDRAAARIPAPERISSIGLSNHAKFLCSGSPDGTLNVWDTKTGSLVRTFDQDVGWVKHILPMGEGQLVATQTVDGIVRILNLESERMLVTSFAVDRPHLAMVMLSDGRQFVCGGYDHVLTIWNAMTGEKAGASFVGHDHWVTCVARMPDGQHIVSGSADCTVRIWNVENRSQVRKYVAHAHPVACLAVSADGTEVALGTKDSALRVLNVALEGESCRTIQENLGDINAVAFHPRDSSVISCSGTIRVWDANKTNISGTSTNAEKHSGTVTGITFTSDGAHAISCCVYGSVRFWDVRTGKQVGEALLGHSDVVRGVAITPDDRFIITASWDKTVRIWEFGSRVLLDTLTEHIEKIDSLALTPNGEYALTSSSGMAIWVWNLEAAVGDLKEEVGDLAVDAGLHFVLCAHRSGREVRCFDECEVGDSAVCVTDDGLRVVGAFGSLVTLWNLKMQKVIRWIDTGVPWIPRRRRREMLESMGESTNEGRADPIRFVEGKIWYVGYGFRDLVDKKKVILGNLGHSDGKLVLSPDKRTGCLGLTNGRVIFVKLCGGDAHMADGL